MEKFKELIEKFGQSLLDIGYDLIIVVIIILIGKFVINVFSKITKNAMKKSEALEDHEKTQEIKTQMTVVHSANRYIVYLIVIFLCLKQIGLGDKVSSAFVAAGIGGLIISLGAQSIVKDMVAGIFIMFEKQFLVGDTVQIGEYTGKVTSIALRVTYLDCKGKKVIIPNGDIRDVVNYSKLNYSDTIIIPTPYEANTKKVMDIIQKVADKYYKDNKAKLTKDKPEVLGIIDYNTSSIDIGLKIVTKPLQHWQVERELRLLIKEEFDKKKISFPYNHVVVKR